VQLRRQRLENFGTRLRVAAARNQLERRRRLDAIEAQLRVLSPDAVLRRGYTITTAKKGGAILRSVKDVKTGDTLVTRFSDGQVESVAEDQQQPKLFD
jgi:exodeoxyribonuclease VII large subunit